MKPTTALLATILSSCSALYTVPIESNPQTVGEIIDYIHENVTYCLDWDSDDPSLNNWQSPKETLSIGTGDCEDFDILFMWMAHEYFGWEPDILLIWPKGCGLHYICKWDGVWYDPTSGWYGPDLGMDYVYIYTMDYDSAMIKATVFYTRGIEMAEAKPEENMDLDYEEQLSKATMGVSRKQIERLRNIAKEDGLTRTVAWCERKLREVVR